MTHSPKISFKRGDSFKLDLTVTDPNSEASLAFLVVLVAAQVVLQEAIDADPYVAQDEIDAQAAVDAAQSDYDASLIVDISTWTITSKLTWCGATIATFTVTIINAAIGTLKITTTPEISALWKVREHQMDILFVRSEGSTSSETIIVDVERGSTNG